MEVTESLNTMLLAIAGLITAMVSWQVLRKPMGGIALPVGLCVGVISAIGLAQHGGNIMPAIVALYQALAISILVMLVLKPFFKDRSTVPPKKKLRQHYPASEKKETSDDPWENELRRDGKLAKQFTSNKQLSVKSKNNLSSKFESFAITCDHCAYPFDVRLPHGMILDDFRMVDYFEDIKQWDKAPDPRYSKKVDCPNCHRKIRIKYRKG